MLKVGVVGLGYLGEIHIKCLSELSKEFEIIGVYDIEESRANYISQKYNLKVFTSLEALISQTDLVDIVSSTSSHYTVAKQVIESGKHVFIEKPITATYKEAEDLVGLCRTNNVKLQVGHVERFNPAFLAIRNRPLSPLFLEAHRLANYNPRGNDVSVVMDLMIHDLDIILELVKAPVKSITATGASVFKRSLDICNAQIEFDNGCIANLSSSRVSLKNMRKLRFFQPESYVSVDFLKKEVQWIDKVQSDFQLPDSINGFEIPLEQEDFKLQIINTEVKEGNAIKMELEDFAKAIRGEKNETVSVEDAARALQVAEKIEQLALVRLRKFESNL
jgi:predicted dehydrogenase